MLFWRINNVAYVLHELRPKEFERVWDKLPDLIGIPQYWTRIDGEVQWWPQCKDGYPQDDAYVSNIPRP